MEILRDTRKKSIAPNFSFRNVTTVQGFKKTNKKKLKTCAAERWHRTETEKQKDEEAEFEKRFRKQF